MNRAKEEARYQRWLAGKEFWTSQRLMMLAIFIAILAGLCQLFAAAVTVMARHGWVRFT